MLNYNIKNGTYSIVLGNGHFNNILNIKKSNNILCKISNFKQNKHDETKYTDIIQTINNYEYYYSIVDSPIFYIDKNSDFFLHLCNIIDKDRTDILKKEGELGLCFINNDGNMELFESIEMIDSNNDLNIWQRNTIKKIKIFIKHMLYAIYFLHQKKICHFDIKPENIIINNNILNNLNSFHRKFKLIDFGFSEIFPFKNYLKAPVGTVGYIPIKYKNPELHNCEYLPDTNPNDWYLGKHLSIVYPGNLEYSVYKTDSYAFGRSLYYLNHRIEDYYLRKNDSKKNKCFRFIKDSYKNDKFKKLIGKLTNGDIYKRLLPQHALKDDFIGN